MSTAPKESCCRVFNSKDYDRLDNLRLKSLEALTNQEYLKAVKPLASLIEVVGNFIITPEVTMDIEEAHHTIDWAAYTIQEIAMINSQFDFNTIHMARDSILHGKKLLDQLFKHSQE